jgi:hypothetical protein
MRFQLPAREFCHATSPNDQPAISHSNTKLSLKYQRQLRPIKRTCAILHAHSTDALVTPALQLTSTELRTESTIRQPFFSFSYKALFILIGSTAQSTGSALQSHFRNSDTAAAWPDFNRRSTSHGSYLASIPQLSVLANQTALPTLKHAPFDA